MPPVPPSAPQPLPDEPGQRPAASSVSTARPEPVEEELQAGRAATFQLPDLRNKKLWVVAGAAAVVVALVAVVGVVVVTRGEEAPGPKATVRAFFDALRSRDATKALAHVEDEGGSLGWSPPSEVLLSDKALDSKWYKPPKNVQLGDPVQAKDGDGVVVNVTYTVAGETVTKPLRLYLEEGDEEAGTPDRWLLSRWEEQGVTGTLYLTITAPEYEINGVAFTTKETQQAVQAEQMVVVGAFPGTYRVGVPKGPLVTAEPRRVGVLTNEDGQELTIPTELKKSGVTGVRRQVKAYVDKCAAQKVLDPQIDGRECPFTSYGSVEGADEDQRLISWTVQEYPKFDVELTEAESGGVYVSPGGEREDQGVVDLKYTANDGFTRKEVHPSQTQRFSIEGPVAVKNGKITWTPRT